MAFCIATEIFVQFLRIEVVALFVSVFRSTVARAHSQIAFGNTINTRIHARLALREIT